MNDKLYLIQIEEAIRNKSISLTENDYEEKSFLFLINPSNNPNSSVKDLLLSVHGKEELLLPSIVLMLLDNPDLRNLIFKAVALTVSRDIDLQLEWECFQSKIDRSFRRMYEEKDKNYNPCKHYKKRPNKR